jgi:amino acid transporter
MAIAALLIVVVVSYYQIIHGYPSGGGAYVVAHDNLGVWPGLTAAAALLIDYVLTVAVSITAGMAAITSAFPALSPYRVPLALFAILIITWGNLRGVRESGTAFAIPTYAFLAIVLTLIITGGVQLLRGTIPANGGSPPPSGPDFTAGVTLFLILRAFASGCAAMTGVEAISNGLPAFRKPEPRNAGQTLIAMAAILTVTFLGITFLARALGTGPTESETVVSQLGRSVFGSGALYLMLQFATAIILVLAANTSFAGFPRLAAIMAHDRYLPRQLTNLGDRLVYSNGILALAALAGALVILFGGDTHRLIPLYAVGVFLSFTLAQAGMVRHWVRIGDRGWRLKAVVNGVGAGATGAVLCVIMSAKFVQGAWVVVLLIPLFVWGFSMVERHYASVATQLSLEGRVPEPWTGIAMCDTLKVVTFVSGVHRGMLPALQFARTLSSDVYAVVVDVEPDETERVREKWPVWGHDVPLVVLDSPYRSTLGPMMAYLHEVDQRDPELGLVVVVLPEFVPARWWHSLLHNQTASAIRTALMYQRGQAGEGRIVINVPYYLKR